MNDDDELPEHICTKCIKQLEEISLFIGLCKSNDESLRSIISKQREKLKVDQNQDDDHVENEDFDDIKSEISDSESCSNELNLPINVKVEVTARANVRSLKTKNNHNIPCESCNEEFSTNVALIKHYEKSVLCRPSDFPVIENVPNILDFLEKKGENRTEPSIKQEKEEPEYVNGKKLKGKRKHLCNYCGKNYTRKNGLDRHMLTHSGVKPFECKECGKRYITKDTLKTHLLTHTGVKAHKCEVCNKSFVQSSHLGYHMKRHAGDKPHKCVFCGKAFLSTYHLERHKLMHTGVKPYSCNQCGKQFVRSTTLRDHMLIHSGERPFQCQHCGKQFTRKQLLTNHVLVHTGQSKGNSGNIGQHLHYNSNPVATNY